MRLYCSAACLDAALNGWPAPAAPDDGDTLDLVRTIGPKKGALFAIGLGIASLSPCARVGTGPAITRSAALSVPAPGVPDQPTVLGPPAPNDEDLALEFVAELGGERWIHPLPGPVRRMPIRSSRVFGAERQGDRPGECRSGHCGVDIGGEMWGETVYAVADGVVDRVNRRPEGSGGMYVRVAHRGAKLFTQYFHLAAIPRGLGEGDKVSAGQVIGLVGDTGVSHSNAHLHFTVSVRPTERSHEIYIDPEPLIALWPLKVPRRSGGADAAWDPGVPLGAAGRPHGDRSAKRRRSKRDRKARAAETETAPNTEAADTEPAPEPDTAEDDAPTGRVATPGSSGLALPSAPP